MNNTYDYLERIENPTSEITLADINQLAGHAENMVGMVTNTLNNITATATDIAEIAANVKIQCAQLEHSLDCLMLKAQRDVKIYEVSLPVLNKQFEACQNRLDRLMDKAMDMIADDFSDSALARQECMMSLIEIANNSLNALITKLIPSY